MAKSKTTTSFRFEDDFIELLDTWSFVTNKEKGVLLQEAFREFAKMEQNADTAAKVKKVSDVLNNH
ncbi:hypothetical protein [Paenibacillus xylanexedens]|uniref:Transcriptional regulator n=1 Tax=Paenibacillus xylanexedens TaxID=528191 RepID=A0ABS4RLR2_PAEXY|nr:hypothetical protein [Paenibacillus xylanexedens]MBP2243835.1 putative transcriptional regulator [Paenibacillus xylanexedens]